MGTPFKSHQRSIDNNFAFPNNHEQRLGFVCGDFPSRGRNLQHGGRTHERKNYLSLHGVAATQSDKVTLAFTRGSESSTQDPDTKHPPRAASYCSVASAFQEREHATLALLTLGIFRHTRIKAPFSPNTQAIV